MFETIGERIKHIRKTNNHTQQSFADKLGLKRNTVGGYEIGTVTPSDRTIQDICKTFGISEPWLRTGEGDMLAPMNREEEIAQMVATVIGGDNEFQKAIVRFICKRTPQQLAEIEKMINDLLDEIDREEKG